MSYLTSLSNVYTQAVSASNQAYGSTVVVDSNNSTTLAMGSPWSTVSPSYIYYPNQAMAIDGANIDMALGVELDTSGNSYVSGTYNVSAPTIYNSNNTSSGLVLPTNSNSGAFAVKYNSTGTAQFAVAVDGTGNDTGNSVAVDTVGNIVLAGSYDTAAPKVYNANNMLSTSSAVFPSPSGGTSAYIVKYDNTGTAVWNTAIDSAGADGVNSISTDISNNVVVAGSYVPVSAPVNIPQVIVSTFAGKGISTFADGTGTNAGFTIPNAIVIDTSGNLFVTDYSNNRIRKITSDRVVTTFTTGVSSPRGIVIDSNGDFYITEQNNNRISKITSAGVVTILAGSGTATFLDGTGTGASFNLPMDLTIDKNNNLYIADYSNHRIRKITSAGVVTTFAGSGTASNGDGIGTNAGLNNPIGIAIDQNGNLYVSNVGNSTIRKITSSRVVTTFAGSGTGTYFDGTGTNSGFSNPYGVCVDTYGNLYISDYNNSRIRKITPSGVVTTLAGSGISGSTDGVGTNATLNGPRGIAVDSSGNIYIGEQAGFYIRKLTQTILNVADQNTVTTIAGSGTATYLDGTGTVAGLNQPQGIAVDFIGNMYVADTTNHRIRKITTTGVVTTLAGKGIGTYLDATGTNAGFWNPFGVTVDSAGNVYVGDQSNNRIRKITSAGVVTTFAGSGTATYLDATGTSAGFNNPRGIILDSLGNMYVCDQTNHRIRKITSAGVVTTFAGSGTATYLDATGTSAGFNNPVGIALDFAGNMYVGDVSNTRVRKITTTGVVTTFAGSGTATWFDATGTYAGFWNPYGLTVDLSGNVYVADTSNQRIRKITSTGIVTTLAGGSSGTTGTFSDGTGTNTGFNAPRALTVDSTGNVYVADMGNNRIRKLTGPIIEPTIYDVDPVNTYVAYPLSTVGAVTTIVGTGTATYMDGTGTNAGFNQPFGVAADSAGNLYISDYQNNRIRKIDNTGVVSTFVNSINQPKGITIDSSGNLYVCNWDHRIRKITSTGVVTILAGSGITGSTNATGTNASFNYPLGIAVDSTGNVYVADYANNLIRKITSVGVVTTLAGSGTNVYLDATGTNAGFRNPVGLVIDSVGNLYVTDEYSPRIRKITSSGVVTTLAGSGTATYLDATGTNAGFWAPQGITIDFAGNMYVADYGNQRIRKITSAGVVTTLAGSGTATYLDGTGTNAGFKNSEGITVDSMGNVYIADCDNHRIRRIETLGVGVSVMAGSGTATYLDGIGINAGFQSTIWGLAIDPLGNIYVGDGTSNRIRKITSAGVVSTFAGSGTATYLDGIGTNAGFNDSRAVTLDLAGNLYVADLGNQRIRKITSAGVVTTLAGKGTATYLDGIGTNAGFNNPWSLAVDTSGNVYVDDYSNNRIRKITSDGVVTTLAGGNATLSYADGIGTNAAFRQPYGIAVDLTGNVYLSDSTNNRIRKITSAGVVTTFAGGLLGTTATFADGIGTNAGFSSPSGLSVDSVGNIYVADRNNGYIRKITPSQVVSTITNIQAYCVSVDSIGNLYVATTGSQIKKLSAPLPVSTLAGSGTATYLDGVGVNAGFLNPRGVTVDSTGNVYLADAGNQRIRKITSAGVVTTLAGSGTATFFDGTGTNAGFNNPYAVAIDSLGNVYVTDYNNNRIRKITSAGVVTTFVGSGAASYGNGTGINSGFNSPSGICIDSSGNLYVSDYGNQRIRKITSAGVVTTLAGSGTATYLDGTGTNAGFWNPGGISVDLFGNVYVGDVNNQRIRKIDATGVVTTLAGSGSFTFVDGIGTNASFWAAMPTAIDSSGNIYIADSGNHRIRKVTSAGIVTTLAGSGTGTWLDGIGTNSGFNGPYAIAIDVSGNLYISDYGNNRIRKISVPYSQGTANSIIVSPTVTLPTGGAANPAAFAIKYNSLGVSQWSAVVDGTLTENASSVTTDSSGNVYVAGMYGSVQPTVYSNYMGLVSTFAGSTSGYLDATGTNARFTALHGIAIDSTGNLYVAEYGSNRIRKIDTSGVVTTLAGSGTATYLDATGTSAGFRGPYGITVDSIGNVYVADTGNMRIRKITSAGVVTTLAGGSSGTSATFADGTGTNAGFNNPQALTVDSTGIVYVADWGNNRIRKIDTSGVVTTFAGSGTGVWLDGTGTNAGLYSPRGIVVDSTGNLYVAEQSSMRVRKITSAGVVTTLAGGVLGNTGTFADGIGTNAGFSGLWGITIDSLSNVYVAEYLNHRIRKITSAGAVTTIAGFGTATYVIGTGTYAGINTPTGITIDSSGNVYVADRGNSRIRKIGITNPAIPTTTTTGNAAFGLKLDSAGYSQWLVAADGINNEQGLGCATDSSGNFYLAGSYGSNVATIYNAYDATSSVTLPAASNTSAFVIKYNQYGTALWSGTVTTDSNAVAYSVATDAFNNVYMAGSYQGITAPIIYGSNNAYNVNAELPYPTGNGGSNTASFVVKYNSNGSPVTSWGMMGSSNSSPYSISVDTYGSNIALTGMFTGPTTLYDGNNAVSSIAFPSSISTQAGFIANYDIAQSPVTLMSSLGVGDNGQQKFITNTGTGPLTLNVTTSNNASVLSTYTIDAGSSALLNWYNGSWYKFI
jgi:hypothetical protein